MVLVGVFTKPFLLHREGCAEQQKQNFIKIENLIIYRELCRNFPVPAPRLYPQKTSHRDAVCRKTTSSCHPIRLSPLTPPHMHC